MMSHEVYPGRPVLLAKEEVPECLKNGDGGSKCLKPPAHLELGFDEVEIPEDQIHDLVVPTMYGLLEDLTPGSPLMDAFLREWAQVEQLLVEPDEPENLAYGQ